MGFLSEGTTFTWEEACEKPIDFVKKHGVLQFLNFYHKYKERSGDAFLWGDEIEYILINLQKDKKRAYLVLRGHEIIENLSLEEKEQLEGKSRTSKINMLWRPEYSRYMIEGTPGEPFGTSGLSELVQVEASMMQRRRVIASHLGPNEYVVTLVNYPHLGAIEHGPFTIPENKPFGPIAKSQFTSDEIIHPHHRFSTLTRNIRKRRGSNVDIRVPLFIDRNTYEQRDSVHVQAEILDTTSSQVPNHNHTMNSPNKPYYISGDSMVFGMGCCCLQCTLQCTDMKQARYLYDQLAVMSPIMLAITAATPFFRGYFANTDCRWNFIVQAVDDRTEEERGLKPLKLNQLVINKSRYDSIDSFLSLDSRMKPCYNDINLTYYQNHYEELCAQGVDELLSKHIAHLFIRDPLVIYHNKLTVDDSKQSDHFENIQSTNWQTVRFKPPPPTGTIGWRVEFRPMEVSLSDFENAAFVVFLVVLARTIIDYDLNLYIPISKVDENMKIAQKIGAVVNEKFYFRSFLAQDSRLEHSLGDIEYELMSIDEIMNGKASNSFPGIISLMKTYLSTVNIPSNDKSTIERYLDFVSQKASGKLMTTAAWLRQFAINHLDYKQDSVISPQMNFDILEMCTRIGSGEYQPKELFGKFGSGGVK